MTTVCFSAMTMHYPQGGGHLWEYLNWALGLQAVGCKVVWLEDIDPTLTVEETRTRITALRAHLDGNGMTGPLCVYSRMGGELPNEALGDCITLEEAAQSDFLLNFRYAMSPDILRKFRRTALLDIDPGLLQGWMAGGQIEVAVHDIYFSIGETVGTPGALFPDCGITWHHAPPAVFLPAWPVAPTPPDARFTTVSQWWGGEWVVMNGESYNNDKRVSFLEFADVPGRTAAHLELALNLGPGDEADRALMEANGWKIVPAHSVTGSPEAYRRYVRESRGEFSCAKPSCMRLQNAWISNRTLCYLASGKPAVVQHTGPSRILPSGAGLFRFQSPEEAAAMLDTVERDYERQSREARALAEERFDACRSAASLLERALT